MNRTHVRERRRRRTTATTILATVAIALVARGTDGLGGAERSAPIARYVVAPGDTLWDIALTVRPGVDPRRTVQAIADANHLDPGSLTPGRSIVVPAVD